MIKMIALLSLVTSAKDYFEIVHKLMEYHPNYSATDYAEFGSIISYIILGIQSCFLDFFSFYWFQNIWSLPIIVPDIASAMISEISVLDGYFHNAFTFLETPLSYGKQNYSLYGLEKFSIGLINSFFLFLPTSAAHIILLRRFVFQGIEGGYLAGIGIIAGNILWLTSIIFGWRFFVIPWLSLDILRYLLGFVILIKFMWHASRDQRKFSNLSKSKIILVNFLLAFTEQTSIYPFVTNLSVGAESSIIETFPVDHLGQFFFIHSAYIFGLLAGSLSFLHLTCWLWENPIAKFYNWLRLKGLLSPSFYKQLNFLFLYLIMLCTIASIPYFGLDYTLTNPLGLISDDRILYQNNKKTNQALFPEASFLNSQASDRNARDSRGRHGRRERWKERLIKYRGMDTSLYDQGVYDLFTIEDLNYGFDKFWLRRKIKNHHSRFRMVIFQPWLLSLKKQLAKPRLISNEAVRVELFRMLYEQFYHPNFHAYSHNKKEIASVPVQKKTTLPSRGPQEGFSSALINKKEKLVNGVFSEGHQLALPFEALKKKTEQTNDNVLVSKGLPTTTNELLRRVNPSKSTKAFVQIHDKFTKDFSALRKFVRKVNTRIKSSEIFSNNKNLMNVNRARAARPIYSKLLNFNKQVLSQLPKAVDIYNIKQDTNTIKSDNSLTNLKIPVNDFKEKWQKFNNNRGVALNPNFADRLGNMAYMQKNFSRQSLDERGDRLFLLSKKDRKIFRYKTILSLQSTRSAQTFGRQSLSNSTGATKKLQSNSLFGMYANKGSVLPFSDKEALFNEGRSVEINNATTMLHPIKFYLQKEKAFKRKFKFYGASVFRKLSIENNAPYFRTMMKRLFYYYKPTLRWTNTLKLAKNKQGHKIRRKKSRTPLSLPFMRLSQKVAPNKANGSTSIQETPRPDFGAELSLQSNNKEIVKANWESKTRLRLKEPTHNFRVVGKNASRYRNQITKLVKQNWFYTPFNRILLKLDVDSFIRRQPNSHFLTKKDEQGLHLKRFLLAEHYETLRWYTYMQHYSSMKTKIGGTKSFASRVYNQQFQGTLKKIRHLFAITPSLFSITKEEAKKNKVLSVKAGSILKFDQSLYNEYSNSKNNSIINDSIIHEELLSPYQKFPLKKMGAPTLHYLSKKALHPYLNIKPDFIAQSTQIVRDYLKTAKPIRQQVIQSLLLKKNYKEFTQFVFTGQKNRGIKATTNQRSLLNQEKFYLAKKIGARAPLPRLGSLFIPEELPFDKKNTRLQGFLKTPLIGVESQLALPLEARSFNKNVVVGIEKSEATASEKNLSLQLRNFLKKTARNLNIEQDLWFSLLKNYKKGLYDPAQVTKFIERRVKKREKRQQKKEKELKNRLKRLQNWLTPNKGVKLNTQKMRAITNSLTTGLNNAMKDGLLLLENGSSSSKKDVLAYPNLQANVLHSLHGPVLSAKLTQLKKEKESRKDNKTLVNSTQKIFGTVVTKTRMVSYVLKNKIKKIIHLILSQSKGSTLLVKSIKKKDSQWWEIKEKMLKKRKRSRNKYTKEIKKTRKNLISTLRQKKFPQETPLNSQRPSQSVSTGREQAILNMGLRKFQSKEAGAPTFPFLSVDRNTDGKLFLKGVNPMQALTKKTSTTKIGKGRGDALSGGEFSSESPTLSAYPFPQGLGRLNSHYTISKLSKIKALLIKKIEVAGVLPQLSQEGAASLLRTPLLRKVDYLEQERKKKNSDDLAQALVPQAEHKKQSLAFLYLNTLYGDKSLPTKRGFLFVKNKLMPSLSARKGLFRTLKPKFRRKNTKSRRNQRFGRPHHRVEHPSNKVSLERKSANMLQDKRLQTIKQALLFFTSINSKGLNGRSSRGSEVAPWSTSLPKKIKSKKRNWKKYKKGINAEKGRKARKQNVDAVQRAGALTKQIKRIKFNLKLQQWWWQNFLPNIQATAEATWQLEKDRQLQQTIANLSKTEVLEQDFLNASHYTPHIAEEVSLQIGDYDFKPLAIPQSLRIRENFQTQNLLPRHPFQDEPKRKNLLSLEASDLAKSEFLPPSSLSFKKDLAKIHALENGPPPLVPLITQKTPLRYIVLKKWTGIPDFTNAFLSKSASLWGMASLKKSLINTNSLPFYAGWDESLRKFVVTNRLLSRREAGYSSSLVNSTKIEFTNAPLKGMNAGTTLYCQVPFTTFDPDQMFSKGMDGFAPIGWRRFEFTHTIFKTNTLFKWLNLRSNKTKIRTMFINKKEPPLRPLLIKNIYQAPQNDSPFDSNYFLPSHLETSSDLFKTRAKMISFKKPYSGLQRSPDTIKKTNNYSRRLKKHYKRIKKLQNEKVPAFLMSGPLIHEVLPINYINIFNKQNRLSKDRYLKRRLRRGKKAVPRMIREFHLKNAELVKFDSYESNLTFTGRRDLYDFTFRRRLKTRRKYHRKPHYTRGIEVRPRRHKLVADYDSLKFHSTNKTENFHQNSATNNKNASLARSPQTWKVIRKRPSKRRSKKNVGGLGPKLYKKTNSAVNGPNNLKRRVDLRRRVSRQVIKTVPRRRPRAGGLVWPGDYLRLEQTESPKLLPGFLKNKNGDTNLLLSLPAKLAERAKGALFYNKALLRKTAEAKKQKVTRQLSAKPQKKARLGLLDLYVQPRKYLLEKHNIKVIKNKLEKAQRINKIQQRIKELE